MAKIKQQVEISLIFPDDLVSSPCFSDVRLMAELDWAKLRREKEIQLRREKIEKIRNGIK